MSCSLQQTPWTAAHQAFPSTISLSLLKLLSIECVMLPKHHIFCHLLLLLPLIFPNLFPMSQLFPSGGQNIGASASASVLQMNIQGWFSLGLTALISLLSKGLSRVFSNHSLKASILRHSAFLMVHLSHPYMTTGKTIALTSQTFVSKMKSLLFNMLFWFVVAFLQRSNHILISRLQSPSKMILEPKKIKSVTVAIFPHLFAMK